MISSPGSMAKYAEALRAVATQYGERSNAALMVRLEFLLSVLRRPDALELPVLGKLIDEVTEHYRQVPDAAGSRVASHISVQRGPGGDVLYRFSASGYASLYGSEFGRVARARFTLAPDSWRLVQDGKWYLYVVTADDETLVYDQPIDAVDLVLNRNAAGTDSTPLVHPSLVYDRDFTVKAAGEVGFSLVAGQVRGVVANTKSGHFRPFRESADIAMAAFRSLLPSAVTVAIPVGRPRPTQVE